MNIPDSNALDAITDCLCRVYRAEKGGVGCLDCPLHKIKTRHGGTICSLYVGNDEERLELLQACIKHGNATIFKDLSPEYKQFVTRTVTVV